jgi:hypothetical protein
MNACSDDHRSTIVLANVEQGVAHIVGSLERSFGRTMAWDANGTLVVTSLAGGSDATPRAVRVDPLDFDWGGSGNVP